MPSRKPIDAYWESLTPEQQAELEAAADAQADPENWWTKPARSNRSAQTIRRHEYIRQLLKNREPIARRGIAPCPHPLPFQASPLTPVGVLRPLANARSPSGLPFGHGLQPAGAVGDGRLPCQTSMFGMAIADPSPEGGRFAPPVVCFCSDRPHWNMGGGCGKRG